MKLGDMSGVPLPHAATGQRTATPTDQNGGGADLAWRREMERAQSDAWFLGVLPAPVRGQQPAAQQTAASTTRSATATHAALASDRTSTTAEVAWRGAKLQTSAARPLHHRAAVAPGHSTHSSQPSAAKASERAFPAADGVHGAAVTAPGESVTQLQQSPDLALRLSSLKASHPAEESPFEVHLGAPGDEAAAAEADEHTASTPRAGRLPVRVHVEGDDQRSTVWLGVDAAALAQLPDLAIAVRRWLTRAGYGEPTWICNGQPLDARQLGEDATPGTPDAARGGLPRPARLSTFVMNPFPGETV